MTMKKLSVSEYKAVVREAVSSEYATNDKAHGIDHADDVCAAALIIAERTDTLINPKMIIAAAYCHDLFSKVEKDVRKVHHIKAHDFVLTSKAEWLDYFSMEERRLIAKACMEHRASWDGGYSHPLSVIIASADKGMPDLDKYLYRAYQYAVEVLGFSEEEAIVRAIHHINYKFGYGGKAKVPSLWESYFDQELKDMRIMLQTLMIGIDETKGIKCVPLDGCTNHFKMDINITMIQSVDGSDLSSLLANYYVKQNQNGSFTKILFEHWFPGAEYAYVDNNNSIISSSHNLATA